MTPATSSPDASAATRDDWSEALLARLRDWRASIVYFPVRHHSPAGAALVVELIERIKPAAVLVEGPSDYNPHLDELRLDHQLPIAIYSYFRDASGEHRAAYYPFCDYSPEWAAIRAAYALGAPVRFIDLPFSEVADLDRHVHRYADPELKRGKYTRAVCARLGVESFDDAWDHLIESRDDLALDDYLERVHSLCFRIRLWEDSTSAADARRERFMAERIRAAHDDLAGPLLVVTGGFHSAALAARLSDALFAEGRSALGLDDVPYASPAEPPREMGVTLTAYSYPRLDALTGYESGMPNPGFYDHAWRARRAGEPFSHRPLLVELARELRAKNQTVGTADLIALETSARALAALRGRSRVWRADLIDATISSLVKDELEYGAPSPLLDAVHAILRGNRRGKLAAGTRLPPLVADVRRRLADAELEPSHAPRDVELDLLAPRDRERSRLLHRLKILGVQGFALTGGVDFLSRVDLTRLWENWSLRWSPEFETTCVEAARYGPSLPQAANEKFVELAGFVDRSAADAAALLLQAARCGVETISADLVNRLGELIARSSDFGDARLALGHLLFLYRYDEAFGSADAPRVGELLGQAFSRSLWLLEALGETTGSSKPLVAGLRTIWETFDRAGDRLGVDREELIAVFRRVLADERKPSAVRGGAAGVLWTLGAVADDAVLAALRAFSDPARLGDFLTGLFALAREMVQRRPGIVRSIDRMLLELSAEDFQLALPALRLAFTYFTPREKHHLLATLFESLGVQNVEPLAELAVAPRVAAAALTLEETVFGAIEGYGLAGDDS